ncbi:unnamed protein product [Triticum turgidum subsp. durum]|uniref:Cyclin-like domain-containing protein n=1 Tax=Triticum turgidum subsp. durum TaxID=4567 RepID=A0A9R1NQ60_TRITD|nr:unnamed protein product [Triticum turgidum subsp. durum]
MDMPGEDEYVYGYEYEFDLENPFTSPADEPIASLLDAEAHHAPSVSAAASAVRRDAARFISKVRYDGELAVHPRVAYLALNYVDRFLSKGQLPFERKPWAPRLLAISCLSIAAKMQRVDAISMDYIQREEEFMFDAVTIRRMERVVLGALEWRARSVTPLAFLGFFLSACFPPPRHPALLDAVKERAVDLLLRAQPGEATGVRRGDGGGLRCGRRRRRTGGERRDAGDGPRARPLPQRQLGERPDRRIGSQRRRCQEAMHGPTFPVPVGVSGVRCGRTPWGATAGRAGNLLLPCCSFLPFPIYFPF